MKAMAGPGTGKIQIVGSLNLGKPCLRCHGALIKDRVGIAVAAMDKRRIGFLMRIQRFKQRILIIDGLQPIHPVGEAQRGIDRLAADIVP